MKKKRPNIETRIEEREYVCSNRVSGVGRSSVVATCPFCRAEVVLFLWSLAGSGKRCACGAKFAPGGLCARLVVRIPDQLPDRPNGEGEGA